MKILHRPLVLIQCLALRRQSHITQKLSSVLCGTAAVFNAEIMYEMRFLGSFLVWHSPLFSPTLAQNSSPLLACLNLPDKTLSMNVVCLNMRNTGTYIGQGLVVCSFGGLRDTPINGALKRNYGYLETSMLGGAAIAADLTCQIAAQLLLEKRLWAVI